MSKESLSQLGISFFQTRVKALSSEIANKTSLFLSLSIVANVFFIFLGLSILSYFNQEHDVKVYFSSAVISLILFFTFLALLMKVKKNDKNNKSSQYATEYNSNEKIEDKILEIKELALDKMNPLHVLKENAYSLTAIGFALGLGVSLLKSKKGDSDA